jgi:hypothetical protein
MSLSDVTLTRSPLLFPRNMLANSASVRILIKGGKVVNDDCTHEADVYIESGIIQQVGRELMIPGGAKVIDATGKLVIPGGIDTSTHFHQTFMNATCVDDFYHGTKVTLYPKWLSPCCFLLFLGLLQMRST